MRPRAILAHCEICSMFVNVVKLPVKILNIKINVKKKIIDKNNKRERRTQTLTLCLYFPAFFFQNLVSLLV